jgi:ketosteroid isomerase-like protein
MRSIPFVARAALGAALACAPTLRAQQMPANLPPARAALWREIRAVNDSMEAAFGRGDMKTVAAFYADDAKMTGGGPIVEGRAAIDDYWRRIGTSKGTWKLEVYEVGGSRELAYQKGRSVLTLRDASGVERVSTVDFVVIWRRDSKGGLRIALDLY